jgi:hypothetical protein
MDAMTANIAAGTIKGIFIVPPFDRDDRDGRPARGQAPPKLDHLKAFSERSLS